MPAARRPELVPLAAHPAACAGAGGGGRAALPRHEPLGGPSVSPRLKLRKIGILKRMRSDFVYLASASPRRHQLLKQIGVPFQVLNVTIDESVGASEKPLDYVARVASAKAGAGFRQSEARGSLARPVLAADTAVVIDGEILGKPIDVEDAQRMLRLLSGRTHQVLTAVALATQSGLAPRLSRSEVTFRAIGVAEARDYWDTGEPHDKAGG